jgi:hypothetical protein
MEDELYEIELSSIQDVFNLSGISSIGNPFMTILKNLGLMSLNEDLLKRLQKTFPKTNTHVS